MSDDAPQLNAANIDNGLVRLDWSDTTAAFFTRYGCATIAVASPVAIRQSAIETCT